MATTLTLHRRSEGNIRHWQTYRPYGTDEIDAIRDPEGGNTEQLPTSIPSPFARLDLVRAAFQNLARSRSLTGTVNDERVVSDSLDVGELFFNFDKLKDRLSITAWDARTDLERLLTSANKSHKRLGEALKLFLDQDKDTYNFDKIRRLFILSYQGRVVGGTSPKTLFFPSGNDLSWVDIRFGNDRLFDRELCPLHLRDIEYQKFWYALQRFMPNFREQFREVYEYLDHSRRLLEEQNPALFHEHIQFSNGESRLTEELFQNQFEELTTGQASDVVEVLGFPLRKKKADVKSIEKVSDFIIKSDKFSRLYPDRLKPMALQNRFHREFTYVPQAKWNPTTPVPYFVAESWQQNQRPLPGQPGNYPWLTVSDLLEPYLVRLPYPINRAKFFDGNLQSAESEKGYLLPLKKDFFDFFDVEDLSTGRVRLRLEPRAGGGIQVTLELPVTAPNHPGNQYVTFERLYVPSLNPYQFPIPQEGKNEGVIVEDSFTVNIYPFIRSGRVALRPDYRIQLIESGYGKRNEYELRYFEQGQNAEATPESTHTRSSRMQNIDGTSQYYVLKSEFDYAQASVKVEGQTLTGLLIPKWKTYEGGGKRYAFAVDFGTTNTHIEYKVDGQYPRAFDIKKDNTQVGTLVATERYDPMLSELFLLYELEFIPPVIGPGSPDSFPARTAIAERANLNYDTPTATLADFNIPFYVERQTAGINKITTNLKWAKESRETTRRIEAYLEELMMLIRNKVVYEDGILKDTKVYWFFPASMTRGRINELKRFWETLFKKHISDDASGIQPVSESISPFYYYKESKPMLGAAAKPVVNVDIGGGTSDVVVYEHDQPRLLTSFRFAGNAIYGDAFSEFGAANNNGFIRKYESHIQRLLDSNSLSKLGENNRRIRSENRSEDLVAFWFSIEKSNEVRDKNLLSFNRMLADDDDLKIVFVFFYAALLYHIARMMKHAGLGLPVSITFSGTGSKLLNIISTDDAVLRDLSQVIFEKVFGETFDRDGLTVFCDRDKPKEATCKGALMMRADAQQVEPQKISAVYPATFQDEFTDLSYSDLDRPEVIASVLKEVENFIDFFFELNRDFDFYDNLNVSPDSIRTARSELKTHLSTFLMSGIRQKRDEATSEDKKLEETLFFYPLIGAINKLVYVLGSKTVLAN